MPAPGVAARYAAIGRVQPDPLAGQQVGEHRLAQQRVPEAVAAVVGDHEQVVVHGLGQRRLELTGAQPADRGHQLVAHAAAGDGGDPQHLLRGRGRCSTRASSTSVRPSGSASPCRPAGHQLLGVEGVALGAGDDVVHGRVGQPAAARGRPRTSAPTSASGSGPSSMRSTPGSRTSSASSGRRGWRRCRSSER